jgi:hypothetical protein
VVVLWRVRHASRLRLYISSWLEPDFSGIEIKSSISKLLRIMSGPTSRPLALVVLILLPFDVATWILRFYVRLSRRAWGPDDWSMLAAIVRHFPSRMA